MDPDLIRLAYLELIAEELHRRADLAAAAAAAITPARIRMHLDLACWDAGYRPPGWPAGEDQGAAG